MLHPIRIGGILFTPREAGAHIHVVVRGHGEAGSKPLLGNLTMSKLEWSALYERAEIVG